MHINDVYHTRVAIREVMGMLPECDRKENLRVSLEACEDTIREFESMLEQMALAEEASQS